MDGEFRIMDDIEGALTDQYKNWRLDDDGTIHLLGHEYCIESDRLGEQNWLKHIFEKSAPYYDKEFYTVYTEALRRRGVKKITIDLMSKKNEIELHF